MLRLFRKLGRTLGLSEDDSQDGLALLISQVSPLQIGILINPVGLFSMQKHSETK
jgi:hypothetical protein